MKTLYILRHAKSSWDHPELSDFERPLNGRGRKAAPRIGVAMMERGYSPQIVISSTARRAKETTGLVVENAGFEPVIEYDGDIYGAGANSLLYIVSSIGDEFGSAMIVGHNPGFEMLVELLTRESVRMPTAALAVVELGDWNKAGEGAGELVDLLIPKELG